MEHSLKIIFAGGGTGGHLYSGVAVAQEFLKKFPQTQILFVGTPFGIEKKVVPELGFNLELMNVSPLKGSGAKARFASLIKLPQAYRQAKKILKKFKPDLVMGIGGYASGPMVLAAHFSQIPTAIIEQNAYPGYTNRKLGRFVDRIFLAFEGANSFFPAQKVVVTGNPLRKEFSEKLAQSVSSSIEAAGISAKKKMTIFILGGSQGAHSLNQAMVEALPLLGESREDLHFIHQTGTQDETWVRESYEKSGFSAEVFAFSSQIVEYYRRSNLVFCRSGAGTITELNWLGLPAILVPYPFAADDHQRYNAQEMVQAGAAELLLNSELQPDKVASKILYFLKNPTQLEKMASSSQKLAKLKAVEDLCREAVLLVSVKKDFAQ